MAVSDYLIGRERQIVKKIPFLLEVKQHAQALQIAVKGGDPNNINKVLSEIIKTTKSNEGTIKMALQVQDGLRHLRNIAKKRHNVELLREVYAALAALPPPQVPVTGLRQGDMSELGELMKEAYWQEKMDSRLNLVGKAGDSAQRVYKDQFYTKLFAEVMEYSTKAINTFTKEKGNYNIDGPLASLISFHAAKGIPENSSICKSLKNECKINEQLYFTVCVRSFA